MDANWEEQQESLVRNAELLPALDASLKRRVLLEATMARKKSVLLRRLAIAASVMLFVGTSSFGVMQLLNHNNVSPVADSSGSTTPGDSTRLTDEAIDQLEKRSRVFPASMYQVLPKPE